MKTKMGLCFLATVATLQSFGQPCTTSGDETTYGTGNTWIGYVYDNTNFTTYRSYVTEGTAGSPAFDQSFGGDNVNYNTTGCFVNTETFSVRYKLIKSFADGDYEFTVGADDGYRLSIDGGSTWVINNWGDHGYGVSTYSVHLNGSRNMILEYYENGGGNRVSFDVQPTCMGSGSQTTYGTGNVWIGYLYDGTNFNLYKGSVTEGTATNANFDESFGGSNTVYTTTGCSVTTETFSARYRLTKNFGYGTYIFTVGGDDGYRLSFDGGSTWAINRWSDQSYGITTYVATLSGNTNMVLEYYESGGDNRISFNYSTGVLPIYLIAFDATTANDNVLLDWQVTDNSTSDYFEIERSTNGAQFNTIGRIRGNEGVLAGSVIRYSYVDSSPLQGASFYRLKMVDRSGEVTFSSVENVNRNKHAKEIKIYPTISTGKISIVPDRQLNSGRVHIYDLSGKKIFVKNIGNLHAGSAFTLSLTPFAQKGMLLLQILDNGQPITTKKIILQ